MADVPAEALAMIAPLLAAQRRQAVRNGTDLPAALLQLLDQATAAEHTAAVPPVAATGSTPSPSNYGPTYGAVQVAQIAGCTRRAVIKAAHNGRLSGHLTDHGWQFTRTAITAWTERREARVATLTARRHKSERAEFLAERTAQLADVEQQLSALDDEQGRLEHLRDSADVMLAAVEATDRDPVARWRAIETKETAETKLAELVADKVPLVELRSRLAEVVAGPEADRRELAQLRAVLRYYRLVDQWRAAEDANAVLIADMREARRDAVGQVSIPRLIVDHEKNFGPWQHTGTPRLNLDHATDTALASLPGAIADLEARVI